MGCFGIWMEVLMLGVLAKSCKGEMWNSSKASSTPFPAFFILGDSLVDVGNNNYILSLARANFKPYGMDFAAGPTGRFTNGKTVLDVIAEFINLPYPPPYLAPTTKGQAILKGINYASGAGGILRQSGFNYIGRVDFDTQLDWFENTISEMQQLLAPLDAREAIISKSFYSLVFGNNDYINNYLLKVSPASKQYSPAQYQSIVLNKYASQITRLYNLGARFIAVSGIGPLGCLPSTLVAQKSVNGECSSHVNGLVINFNTGLQSVIQQLNQNLTGVKIIYADTYNPVLDIRNNPQKHGFQVSDEGCCGMGRFRAQGPCLGFVTPCKNRDSFVFWDPYHPTQAANLLLGKSFFKNFDYILNHISKG